MRERFDLIIFDWDGTLVDSIDWIVNCIQTSAEGRGCVRPSPQAVKDIVGLSIENALEALFPKQPSAVRREIAADYSRLFFSKAIGPDDLFPGVYGMLETLKSEGFLLAVATGKKKSGLSQAISAAGVADLFCTTRCADQTASKPNPLMINQIVEELGVEKTRTLMVGDSVHDLQMAANANVAAIGVTCGAHSEATLRQYDLVDCLNYPTDLLPIIL